MRRKSGSFEIIRKVLKNEVEVIVTRKLCFCNLIAQRNIWVTCLANVWWVVASVLWMYHITLNIHNIRPIDDGSMALMLFIILNNNCCFYIHREHSKCYYTFHRCIAVCIYFHNSFRVLQTLSHCIRYLARRLFIRELFMFDVMNNTRAILSLWMRCMLWILIIIQYLWVYFHNSF